MSQVQISVGEDVGPSSLTTGSVAERKVPLSRLPKNITCAAGFAWLLLRSPSVSTTPAPFAPRIYDQRKIDEKENNGVLKKFCPHHLVWTQQQGGPLSVLGRSPSTSQRLGNGVTRGWGQ